MTRSRLVLALSIAFGCLLAVPTSATAQKKARPACGMGFLPFAVGAEWTYNFTVPDDPAEQPKGQIQLDVPEKITIKVVGIEEVEGMTEIHLEESYREVKNETVIRCDREDVLVDPGSFYATGEPGGGLAMTVKNFKRADYPSYRHKRGRLKKDSWREDVSFDVERHPSEGTKAVHGLANVEVERAVKVVGRDGINSELQNHPRATKVEINITGRARVGGKSVDMPAAKAMLWFDDDFGIVRAENRFGQGWTLSSFSWPER